MCGLRAVKILPDHEFDPEPPEPGERAEDARDVEELAAAVGAKHVLDADLLEWGSCYCALYVSEEMLQGEREAQSIPERRPPEGQRPQDRPARAPERPGGEPALPVWRCRVCGYLCAREKSPGVCPICKAKRDRFERFW